MKASLLNLCLTSLFVFQSRSLHQSLHDVYDDVTINYSESMSQGGFCATHSEEDCLSYLDGLHEMLTSISSMVSTSPHIKSPVQPVVTLFDHEMLLSTSTIKDPEISYSLERFLKEDMRHADIAKKKLQSGQTTPTTPTTPTTTPTTSSQTPSKQYNDLIAITTQIKRLRTSLAVFTDQVYESVYLSQEVPLKLLAPIARAIGSLFQRTLFNWQLADAKQVDFYYRLLASERRYLELFFELYGFEQYNFHFGLWYGNRMSSFTWSHRSRSTSSSIRFACGTTSQEEPFAVYAQDVLKERSIVLEQEFEQNNEAFSFYGLGWDLEENNFKLYLMFHGVTNLPETYKSLATNKLKDVGIDLAHAEINHHGLISLTYYENMEKVLLKPDTVEKSESILHERKVYLYPTVSEASKKHLKTEQVKPLDGSSTSNVAWLLASKRGFVEQFDAIITPSSMEEWRLRLGEKGEQIIDRYKSIHLKLETIAYQSKDKWTIYFPAGSG